MQSSPIPGLGNNTHNLSSTTPQQGPTNPSQNKLKVTTLFISEADNFAYNLSLFLQENCKNQKVLIATEYEHSAFILGRSLEYEFAIQSPLHPTVGYYYKNDEEIDIKHELITKDVLVTTCKNLLSWTMINPLNIHEPYKCSLRDFDVIAISDCLSLENENSQFHLLLRNVRKLSKKKQPVILGLSTRLLEAYSNLAFVADILQCKKCFVYKPKKDDVGKVLQQYGVALQNSESQMVVAVTDLMKQIEQYVAQFTKGTGIQFGVIPRGSDAYEEWARQIFWFAHYRKLVNLKFCFQKLLECNDALRIAEQADPQLALDYLYQKNVDLMGVEKLSKEDEVTQEKLDHLLVPELEVPSFGHVDMEYMLERTVKDVLDILMKWRQKTIGEIKKEKKDIPAKVKQLITCIKESYKGGKKQLKGLVIVTSGKVVEYVHNVLKENDELKFLKLGKIESDFLGEKTTKQTFEQALTGKLNLVICTNELFKSMEMSLQDLVISFDFFFHLDSACSTKAVSSKGIHALIYNSASEAQKKQESIPQTEKYVNDAIIQFNKKQQMIEFQLQSQSEKIRHKKREREIKEVPDEPEAKQRKIAVPQHDTQTHKTDRRNLLSQQPMPSLPAQKNLPKPTIPPNENPVSYLNQAIQRHFKVSPIYTDAQLPSKTPKSGNLFQVVITLPDSVNMVPPVKGYGTGPSKKEARKLAALDLFNELVNRGIRL